MNKKQIIVLWFFGLLLISTFLRMFSHLGSSPLEKFVLISAPAIIIGALLYITIRKKLF